MVAGMKPRFLLPLGVLTLSAWLRAETVSFPEVPYPDGFRRWAHVASAVVYMASLPIIANVQFMTVMATKMPFVGRG